MKSGFAHVESLSGHNATVAKAYYQIGTVKVTASGTAKLDPADRNNPQVAELLAEGRALEALGRKMRKRAEGLTKHADDMRENKKKNPQLKAGKKAKAKKKNKKHEVPAHLRERARANQERLTRMRDRAVVLHSAED